jgi:tyrosyl-tRNA synthetase
MGLFFITRFYSEYCTEKPFQPALTTKYTESIIFVVKPPIRMDLIEELTWRGMIQDIMPGTKEQLAKEMTAGYIGFDPTADSLHIGSLVPILLLVHLQKAGHKPVALVGGATGMVGDPSGKSEERNLLSEETLNHNLACVKRQLEKFLDFDPSKPNSAEMANNYDWFRDMSFLHFIRDVGKHITVNYMSAKDSVRRRLESENGMSFTEFTYQLVQGYDFYWLYSNRNCKLQMGGSDQWGNITTGTELIRRKSGGEAFAFTCPLLTKTDGGKFGKTEKGNVWLDPEKTSPYQFYQFWLNATDADAEKWIKIFTFLPPQEISALLEQHRQQPETRGLQKTLAREITLFVHGEDGYEKAIATTEKFFAAQSGPAESLSEEDLESIEGIARFDYPSDRLRAGIDVVSFLAETGILASKGEARKLIQNGGISINRKKVENPQLPVDGSLLLHNKYILVQKGKKNYYLVKI